MTENKTSDILDLKGASELLTLKPSRIYHLVFTGNIPFYKIGSSLRFSRSQLEAWLRSKQVGAK